MEKYNTIIFMGKAGQKLKELVDNARKHGFEHTKFYAEYKSGIWRLSFIT